MSAGVFELAIDAGDYVSCGGDDGGCPALVPIGLSRCPLCGRHTRPDGDEPDRTAGSSFTRTATPLDRRGAGRQRTPDHPDRQAGGAHRKLASRRLHVVRQSDAEPPARPTTTASDRPGGRHRARRSA